MAFVALKGLRGIVSQTIKYVMDPEKTTELTSRERAELHRTEEDREQKDMEPQKEKRMYVTCLNCTEENAPQQFRETQSLWSGITGRNKATRVVCYHGFQSFAEGEVDAGTAHEIGVKLAERMWGDDHEVVIATHCNTGHYHNHFVLNPVSLKDGRKYRNDPYNINRLREESNRLTLEYGLSVIEEPVWRGRKHYTAYMADKNGQTNYYSLIRDDIDRAVAASVTEREFYRNMEKMGYEFRLFDENGRPSRQPALRPPGAQYFCRFRRLDREGYMPEEIRMRVAENYHRRDPFPEEDREKVRQHRAETQPREKPTGLKAVYVRYCYELHILREYPASVRQVSFFMREDLAKLDALDEQTRFLAGNGIETAEDLKRFRNDTESRQSDLAFQRRILRNEKDRAVYAGDTGKAASVRKRMADLSKDIKKLRKKIRLCDAIEKRSEAITAELKRFLAEQEREKGKEERSDEQLFGRSGGTGRAHEPGRG